MDKLCGLTVRAGGVNVAPEVYVSSDKRSLRFLGCIADCIYSRGEVLERGLGNLALYETAES